MQTPPVLVPPPIPTTNPPKTTEASKAWASVVAMLGCFGISVVALIFIPSATWDWLFGKVGHLFTIIIADPVSASAAVVSVMTFVAGIVAAGRALLHMSPPTTTTEAPRPQRVSRTSGSAHVHVLGWLTVGFVAFLAGCSLLAGCGASALQTAAVGTTIALRAEEAVSTAVNDDLDHRMSACPTATSGDSAEVIAAHNACVDHERANAQDAVTVLDSLEIAIRGVGAGIATAVEIDAGQPLPTVIMDAIRQVLALFDQGEAALRRRGIVVPPEIDMVIAALSALVGAS